MSLLYWHVMVSLWCGGVAATHVIIGIWDVMTNEEVVEFVRSAIAEGTLPDIVSLCCCIRVCHCVCQTVQICERLMTRCLAPDCRMGGVGCDNMTVIIVCLLQGEDYSELSNKCAHLSTASGNSVRERSVNEGLDVDEDNDEWYDCADELLTVLADNGTSCSINHNETVEVVKQEEMREEEDEPVRQGDDKVRYGDEETRQEEYLDKMETDNTTQADVHITNSEQVEEPEGDTALSQSSSVDKEDISDGHNSLFNNGHHDNQAKDTISNKQTNSFLDGQIYKSTAV